MPSRPKSSRTTLTAVTGTAEVDHLLAGRSHPLAREIDETRAAIRAADPSIGEGIKWNGPSFRTTEWFATIHLRSTESVQVILHLGAKAGPRSRLAIDDPAGLLRWLAPDRGLLDLGAGPSLRARLPAVRALISQWVRYLPPA